MLIRGLLSLKKFFSALQFGSLLCLFWVFQVNQAFAIGARHLEQDALNLEPVKTGLPRGLIHIGEDLPNVLWVDLQQGQMYLLNQIEPGRFQQAEAIPISLGKKGYGKRVEGDLRTPVGVYYVTSYIADRKLDAKYGDGAFPFNYPNPFDRLQGRTGSGIWLHGLPKGVKSRPLLDSDGCVVVDNKTLTLLKPEIKPGETVVVLAENLVWSEQREGQYEQFMQTLDQWHADWESLDNERYLSHYAGSFTDFRRNLSAFRQYKTRVNGNKQWVKVGLSRMSVVAHPEHSDLVAVRYYQNYRSSNYNWRGWKQMLWRQQENGLWRIVYEGN